MRRLMMGTEGVTVEECGEAVRTALDSLPSEIVEELGEVAVIIEDRHPEGLMGLYDPIGGLHRIIIFREANPSPEEVRRTVLHEIGHHLGMTESEIDGLGYG